MKWSIVKVNKCTRVHIFFAAHPAQWDHLVISNDSMFVLISAVSIISRYKAVGTTSLEIRNSVLQTSLESPWNQCKNIQISWSGKCVFSRYLSISFWDALSNRTEMEEELTFPFGHLKVCLKSELSGLRFLITIVFRLASVWLTKKHF